MSEGEMKRKKSAKREIIEWVVFLGVIAILWATGLHTRGDRVYRRRIGFEKPELYSQKFEAENPANAEFRPRS
ncbi:MAG: hypothetical protein U5K79_25620 [Cyclobacteriaceae bacterium]|nr:hypothetical protein [Cyclobacteriaceae bacterium]